MADNAPTTPPAGGLPPKPGESAKVQPKKETVRISLPPKPTSAPTIKLPTLPSGGPASAAPGAAAAPPRPAGSPPPPPPSAAAPKAPLPPPPGATGARVSGAPPPPPQRSAPAVAAAAAAASGATGTVARRPVAATSAPTVGKLDKALAFTAMIVSVIALASVVVLGWFNSLFYQPPQ